MRTERTAIPKRALTAFGVALAVTSLLALAGCGDDEKKPTEPGPGGTPTTSSLTGFMSDGVKSGQIAMTVNTATLAGRPGALGAPGAEVSVIATVKFDGATFTAEGTYNDVTDSLNMSGGGYQFIGEYEDSPNLPSIGGPFAGPSSGLWVVAKGPSAGSTYCGMWHSSVSPDSGTFNVVTFGDVLGGVAFSEGGEPQGFIGSLSGTGTTRDVSGYDGDQFTYELTVTGTLNTATGEMSGTWDYVAHAVEYGSDANGTWSASPCP